MTDMTAEERACSESDAESFGLGFLVDGKRVHPSRVVVFRPPGDPILRERERCANIATVTDRDAWHVRNDAIAKAIRETNA